VSYILQRRQFTIDRLAAAAESDAEIFLCPVVHYEIRRGLLDKGASRQLTDFQRLVENMIWAEFDRSMWEDAASSWVIQKRVGRLPQDADLLIAAYARTLHATLVTNDPDFESLGVPLENWAT
jgi:tRNA(fMet)-specific endonuclease VapC